MPLPPSDLPITIRSSPTWWQRIVPVADELAVEEPPLRAELFSADQMEQHGKRAGRARTSSAHARAPDRLLPRLADNETRAGRRRATLLAAAAEADRRITPAGEWLLDNFYLIEEQIRTARRHLPHGYSRELPRLAQRAVGRAAARLRPRARADRARRRPRRRARA